MKLADALAAIEPLVGRPFGDLVDAGLLPDLHTNKGHVGQVLEGILGLRLNSRHLDFEDGELKTNKVRLSGKPIETVAIMQLSNQIDDVLARRPFRHVDLCRKVENLLYVAGPRQGFEAISPHLLDYLRQVCLQQELCLLLQEGLREVPSDSVAPLPLRPPAIRA